MPKLFDSEIDCKNTDIQRFCIVLSLELKDSEINMTLVPIIGSLVVIFKDRKTVLVLKDYGGLEKDLQSEVLQKCKEFHYCLEIS